MEEFEDLDLINKEYTTVENDLNNGEINNLITNLQLFSNNIQMLTKQYTDILEDDNVIYIMTRISQNPVFMKHFPEFYEKNINGESVINCQQNSPYHRYGVFKHILYTIENICKDSLKYSSHDMKILKWTMFLHDIGKPFVKTVNSSGFDSFTGHDDESVKLAKGILERFDFTEEDKKIILTLIKYHDRYLNEGDLTYDNLSFLAKELNDKKDLFQMLIEVKIADNKAKNIDVYNKFMTVVGKYYDFCNEYFGNKETNGSFDEILNNITENEVAKKIDEPERGVYIEGGSSEDITIELIEELSKDITNGKCIDYYYQPIIDLKKMVVNGYEVYYKIITKENFSYKQLMRKAREHGKYDKIQQMLFINALKRFDSINDKKELTGYVNIDAKSYLSYVNKARIFDILEKSNAILEFNNFETVINSKIKEISHEISLHKGMVAIDNFESSNKSIKDIEQIDAKCIKYKLESIEENKIQELNDLSTYCTFNSIMLIVTGIDSKDFLKVAMDCSVRYVQGEYIGKATDGLDMTNDMIQEIIDGLDEELIC